MKSLCAPFLIALTLVVATACGSLELAPAQSFDQKLAYAYGVHTAVQEASAAAMTAKTITPKEGTSVLTLADQSKQLLDAARTVELTGDTAGATQKLVLATAILTQLQAYLQSRGVH